MLFKCFQLSIFGIYVPFELVVSVGCIAAYLLSIRYFPQFAGQYRRVLSRYSR